jgi:shikimate dehydrogenase
MSSMGNFGLIGKSLKHSFSKKYFEEKFKRLSLSNYYELYELNEINELKELIYQYQIQGLNVTIPYKQTVIPYLDHLDEKAAEIGAVNTIVVTNQYKLIGYNTDYYGFKKTLHSFLPNLSKTKALVLGTGGASKAVCSVLRDENIPYSIVSRTPSNEQLCYEDVSEKIADYHLIINTTPLGMFPNTNDCPELPYQLLTTSHYCYDLVYNPAETIFLKKSKQQGSHTLNGLAMLYLQAEKSWELWNN